MYKYIIFSHKLLAEAIMTAIPPTLSVFLNLSFFFSMIRLNKKKINGLDPTKLLQAGSIDTICFDKTGTLTNS